MKKLQLKNNSYQYLEKAFQEWLDILGYNSGTVTGMPLIIREFLHHLETNNIHSIQNLQHRHIKAYHDYISTRAHQRRGGGLSNKYINMHLQAIAKFLEYLQHKGLQNVPSLGIRLSRGQQYVPSVLSTGAIKELFALTRQDYPYMSGSKFNHYTEAAQSRDRAMLTVYYSCGLRRNEGVHLAIDDINFDTRILHIRKGKNYKERFVPFNKTNAQYLQQWIYDYRSKLVKDKREHRLFVNFWGRPMTGGSLYARLKLLQSSSEDTTLTEKNINLHTLRHSIATHLLQAGMSLEKIARFLGHSSLESTQIYTHITKENNEQH
jgi:integrase/recombinase XerD